MITTVSHLEFDVPNQRYRLVIDTDYLEEYNVNMANFGGKILGTIYFNGDIAVQKLTAGDPLVNLQTGETTSAWFDAPLDSSDEIANGSWEGTFTLRLSPASSIAVGIAGTPDNYYQINLDWPASFLEVGDAFTIAGAVTPGNNGARVVTAVVATGGTRVTVSDSLTTAAMPAANMTFDLTHSTGTLEHTYSGCEEKTIDTKATYDCNYGDYGSFTAYDNTDLGDHTLVTTSQRIKYPGWTQQTADPPADVVTTQTSGLISKTILRLAKNSTYTVITTTEVSYTQTDGMVLNYTITQTIEVPVSCNSGVCDLLGCIYSLMTAHVAELSANGVSKYQSQFDQVVGNLQLYREARDCGEDYSTYISNIESVLNSPGCPTSCNTNCCDTTPGWVQNVSDDTITAIAALQAALQYRLYNGVPGVNQDSTVGVQVGAIWQNYNTGIEYRCTDNSAGAAVWVQYSAGIQTLTGTQVDNTDPQNPVVNFPVAGNILVLSGTVNNLQEAYEELLPALTAEGTAFDVNVRTGLADNVQDALDESLDLNQYFYKTTVPNANDDAADGIQLGAFWENINTGIVYRCTSPTAAAATWVVFYDPATAQYKIYNGIPGVNQDATQGVVVGAVWQNYNTGRYYRCTSATAGAATWVESQFGQFRTVTSTPGTGQDTTQGYNVGAIVSDLSDGGKLYRCTNNSAGAATWVVFYPVPFLTYAAKLTQAGLVDPVEGILYNDTGLSLSYTISGAGTYEVTVTGGTIPERTDFLMTNGEGVFCVFDVEWNNTAQFTIRTYDASGTLAHDLMKKATLKFCIYS